MAHVMAATSRATLRRARESEPASYYLLRSIEQAGIPYCLVRRRDGALAEAASDIDLVVPPAVLPRELGEALARAAAACGGLLVQLTDHDTAWSYVVGIPEAAGRFSFVRLDAWPS